MFMKKSERISWLREEASRYKRNAENLIKSAIVSLNYAGVNASNPNLMLEAISDVEDDLTAAREELAIACGLDAVANTWEEGK
jgi:DICT domain-containing protein